MIVFKGKSRLREIAKREGVRRGLQGQRLLDFIEGFVINHSRGGSHEYGKGRRRHGKR